MKKVLYLQNTLRRSFYLWKILGRPSGGLLSTEDPQKAFYIQKFHKSSNIYGKPSGDLYLYKTLRRSNNYGKPSEDLLSAEDLQKAFYPQGSSLGGLLSTENPPKV